jgi:hypothetical protein
VLGRCFGAGPDPFRQDVASVSRTKIALGIAWLLFWIGVGILGVYVFARYAPR